MRRTILSLAILISSSLASSSHAITIKYTSAASFQGGAPGPIATESFDGLVPDTLIPNGGTVGDLTFNYSIAGLTVKTTDNFDTTSASNSLGLTGGDEAFLDGDELTITLSSPVLALGLFVITSDPAIASEIQLTTPVGTAFGSGVAEQVLGDGGIVYFIGLVSTDAFSTATLGFANDGETNFAFNVDDVMSAVPEPGTALYVQLGLIAISSIARTQRPQKLLTPRSRSRRKTKP